MAPINCTGSTIESEIVITRSLLLIQQQVQDAQQLAEGMEILFGY
jgi:hypothetical protein